MNQTSTTVSEMARTPALASDLLLDANGITKAFREMIDGLRKLRRHREQQPGAAREQLPLLPGDPAEPGKGKR